MEDELRGGPGNRERLKMKQPLDQHERILSQCAFGHDRIGGPCVLNYSQQMVAATPPDYFCGSFTADMPWCAPLGKTQVFALLWVSLDVGCYSMAR